MCIFYNYIKKKIQLGTKKLEIFFTLIGVLLRFFFFVTKYCFQSELFLAFFKIILIVKKVKPFPRKTCTPI